LNVLIGGQASPVDSAPKSRQVRTKTDGVHEHRYETALAAFFGRQAAAVLSALGAGTSLTNAWDADRWARELSTDLYRLNLFTSATAAREALDGLGLNPDDYDQPRTLGWLLANAQGVAEGINTTTLAQLQETEDGEAAGEVFRQAKEVRSPSIASSLVGALSGFGMVEAVRQTGIGADKTWNTGPNPRSSHASLNGETVPYDGVFSNGAMWPGDSQLSADERAGCNCRMSLGYGGT